MVDGPDVEMLRFGVGEPRRLQGQILVSRIPSFVGVPLRPVLGQSSRRRAGCHVTADFRGAARRAENPIRFRHGASASSLPASPVRPISRQRRWFPGRCQEMGPTRGASPLAAQPSSGRCFPGDLGLEPRLGQPAADNRRHRSVRLPSQFLTPDIIIRLQPIAALLPDDYQHLAAQCPRGRFRGDRDVPGASEAPDTPRRPSTAIGGFLGRRGKRLS